MGARPNSFPNGNRQIQIIISIKSLSFIFITCHKVKDWNMWSDYRLLPLAIHIGDRSFRPFILDLQRLWSTWDLSWFNGLNGWILTMRKRLIGTRIWTCTKSGTRSTRIRTRTSTRMCTCTRMKPECVLVPVPEMEPRPGPGPVPIFLPRSVVALGMGQYTTLGIGKGRLDSHHLSSPSLLSPWR